MQDVVTETYFDVQDLIYNLAHAFQRRYPTCRFEFDDLVAIGNQCFMETYIDHQPELGQFYKRLQFKIWYRLVDQFRKTAMRAAKAEQVSLTPDHSAHEFPLAQFILEELSHDAAAIVRMVFDAHPLGKRYTPTKPHRIRAKLKANAKANGWTAERIKDAFHEIGQALQRTIHTPLTRRQHIGSDAI